MARILALDTHPTHRRAALYRQLSDTLGHQVTVLYGSDAYTKRLGPGGLEDGFEWDLQLLSGYRARFSTTSSASSSPSPQPQHCRRLLRTWVQARPDVLLWSDLQSRFAAEALTLSWPLHTPWILRPEVAPVAPAIQATPHALLQRLRGGLGGALLQRVYQRADAVAYVGRLSRQYFLDHGVDSERLFFSPFSLSYEGLQTEESQRQSLRGPLRSQLGLSETQRLLLCPGALEAANDPQRVIEAVRSLAPRLRNNTAILFLGAGPLQPSLAERAQRDPQVAVHFANLPRESSRSIYYHAADLTVLPSRRSDHWGTALHESLSHGVRVICSDALQGVEDLVVEGITGLAFRAGSSPELAQAIAALSPKTGDEGLRNHCRDHAGHYSVGESVQGLGRAISAVVHARAASPTFAHSQLQT